MPVADLLSRHPDAWRAATRHPFLDAVRDGNVPVAAFDTWLVQDARFVTDLLVFLARLLARAPRPAQAVLAAGAVSLVAELDWFDEQAAARGSAPSPTASRTGGRVAPRLGSGWWDRRSATGPAATVRGRV